MDASIDAFTAIPPEIVWGVFPRLIGCLFLIAFASLLSQAVPLAGSNGCLPVAPRLAKLREAFSAWRRWLHFPTLLWLNGSDAALRALVVAGMAGAVAVVYGGAWGFFGLLTCYVVYLSLDQALGLTFPWDCALFELAFLGLFLPPWHALPDLAAAAHPAPLLVWAFRLLVLRVMFGFGAFKFGMASREDSSYLSSFLIHQPLPSPLAWHLQKLPVWALQVALFAMFLVEVPVPWLVLHPDLGLVTAVGVVGLMVAIQACGSFGSFSLVMIVACLPLLDTQTPRGLDLAHLFSPGAPRLANAASAVHLFGALLCFPMNSWCFQEWHRWTAWMHLPRWATFPIELHSLLHSWRYSHGYGVFLPHAVPDLRVVPVFEVSWDGERWEEVEPVHACTRAGSAPRFVSPHHPRLDQAIVYDVFGLGAQSLAHGTVLSSDPCQLTRSSPARMVLQRLLEGQRFPGVASKPGTGVGPAPPPLYGRVRTFILRPTTRAEKRRTGAWWVRAYVGPHTPVVRREPHFWDTLFADPETWHWETVVWRRRSRLARLMARARAGEDPTDAVVADAKDLGAADVDRFWDEILPAARCYDRDDWERLAEARSALEARFGGEGLQKGERILGRLCVMGSAKLDPLYLRRGRAPLIPVASYGRLWLLMHDVIWDGREAFAAMLADPLSIVPRARALTLERGLYLTALFRLESLVFQAQKARLIQSFALAHQPAATGWKGWTERRMLAIAERATVSIEIFSFLQDKLRGPAFDGGFAERYPHYQRTAEGRIEPVAGTVAWEPLCEPAPGAPS